MRCLAVITLLVLALALAQPVAAQSFKPDYKTGYDAKFQKDYATALRHLRPLAVQGDGRAQFRLGMMYLRGVGVTHDEKEGVRWIRKAAEQGYALAQLNLGDMYHWDLLRVIKDYKEAARWYRKAANQGEATAQVRLGYMYANGRGVLQDRVMAYIWFSAATANGHRSAKNDRDKALARLNAPERKLGKILSVLCHEKPASCPSYSFQ